jgi:Rv2525c-like, glycoside hydrolase-like domain
MRRLSALVGLVLLCVAGSAEAKVLRFHGHEAMVPASWPVFKLSRHPGMCVRLDRRAVYLGAPAANQRCPAHAVGRRQAILIDPGAATRAARSPQLPVPSRALPRATTSAATVGFTGLGFDACATPSARTMSAWSVSPYRAIGVYIGGVNRACSQPNLTPSWVSTEVAAGWHLIPTYVGLQSPTSSCSSCAKLSSNQATAQGTAAASDAVSRAQSVAIGPGNPIYFDMESYTRTSSASGATLTFLAAWTSRLHALGYLSGVYSSSASGIADLAGQIDFGYELPDDIWIANWNGQAGTADPYVPSNAWARHQRLHQYRGGHNETYGGVTINIDNDFVDGATVGAATPPQSIPPLTVAHVKAIAGTVRLWVRCGWSAGTSCPGQIIVRARVRVPIRARRGARGVRTKVIRVAVARRTFRLAGGRSHTFRVALNARGRPLLRESGKLKGQLLVAIPGARDTRAVQLRRAR